MEINRCMRCMREFVPSQAVCPHCGHIIGTAEKESYHLQQGTILAARYLIGYSLGSGAFGITYAAFDLVLEKRVAIKEYLPGELATRTPGQTTVTIFDGEKTEMFRNGLSKFSEEAQRLLSCNTIPNIVKIYDTLYENNTAYIIMEYLDGKRLKETLAENGGKIKFEEALEYMLPILNALGEVHKLGIIHRDISPDNIMITEENEPKLYDFGAARYANTETSKSLTVLLKPGYAPEEQYRTRGDQGPWSDVYALAATFYKCITGVTPVESIERMANDTLKPPSKLGARLSQNTENAILNAMNKEKVNRTESATVFAAELCSEEPVVRREEEEKKNPLSLSKPLKATLGIVAALLIAIVTLTLTGIINLGVVNVGGRNADIVLVPDMVRMTFSNAENFLNEEHADKKLLLVISGRQISDAVSANTIMLQTPQGGNRTLRGAALNVTISDGAEVKVERGIVPEVTSREEAVAKTMLEDAGFVAMISYEESDNVLKGVVISQSVAAGTSLEEGQTVAIVVSLGSAAQEEAIKTATQGDLLSSPQPTTNHNHEYGAWTTTRNVTCEENGVSTRACKSCSATEEQFIQAPGHDYRNGSCTRCGKPDPSHVHTYSWVTRTNPTCTTVGEEVGTCVCSDSVTRSIPAVGHSFGSNAKCSTCSQLDPEHTHSGEFTRTKNPNCTEQGQDTRTCPVCGTVERVNVPALGHTYTWIVTTAPTCVLQGTETETCSVCNATSATRAVAAKGHTYVWKITTAATCTTDGVETETCSACNETNGTRKIPKANHTYSKGYCTRCGAANPASISIPNVNGMSESAATSTLTDLGFKVNASRAYNWEVGSGTVYGQSATGSGHVGDTITINISSGTKPLSVGDTVYIAPNVRWYADSYGGGSYGYSTTGGNYTISSIVSGRPCPYFIGPGWVSGGSISQRTN